MWRNQYQWRHRKQSSINQRNRASAAVKKAAAGGENGESWLKSAIINERKRASEVNPGSVSKGGPGRTRLTPHTGGSYICRYVAVRLFVLFAIRWWRLPHAPATTSRRRTTGVLTAFAAGEDADLPERRRQRAVFIMLTYAGT
jgi:hypothetical protein